MATRRFPAMLLALLALAVLAGCAPRAVCPAPLPWQNLAVRDVEDMPQDPAYYAAQYPGLALMAPAEQADRDRLFDQRYFAPWDMTASTLSPEDAFWGVAAYGTRQGFGENMLPRPPAFMEELIKRMDRGRFPSLAWPGIALRNAAMRVMPTDKPFFLDFREAGEGFPFDYFQNSALWAGTPLFISHVSTDGAWYFVETGFASGWVHAEDVAVADQAFRLAFRTDACAALVGDGVAVRDLGGRYRFTAHVGAVFPLVSESSAGLVVNIPVADGNGRAAVAQAVLAPDQAARKPLPCTVEAVARVARGLAGQTYGWGGLFEDRDCSAMLRDLFTPFGIWLPRNSTGQGATGRVVSLEGLAPADKERAILAQGVPFATLLWLRGHIMLYLGEYQGRAAAFHNIWGLRTRDAQGNEGRNIIGRAVITSLSPGLEIQTLDPEAGDLLARIRAMAILGGD